MSEEEFVNDFYQGNDFRQFELLKEIYRENKQLKEQLQLYEIYLNRFFKINNKSYDGKVVLEQLEQSNSVIEEALDKVKRMEDSFIQEEHIGSARDDDCELEELRNILNKYKKEESE